MTIAGLPVRAVVVMVACLVGSGCSTPRLPERFHTLLPSERSAAAPAANPLYVDVAAVSVPAQVYHAQWVVRQADDSLLMLEQDRWAAPLRDELRAAIVDRLTARWAAVDVRGLAQPAPATWRVRVDVQRFESVPGNGVRLEASWSLASSQRGASTVVCRSALSEAVVEASVPALAAAHRRAVARLADEIGQRLQASHAGQQPSC
jgi:uncharacterized lipoprotein YmbA